MLLNKFLILFVESTIIFLLLLVILLLLRKFQSELTSIFKRPRNDWSNAVTLRRRNSEEERITLSNERYHKTNRYESVLLEPVETAVFFSKSVNDMLDRNCYEAEWGTKSLKFVHV